VPLKVTPHTASTEEPCLGAVSNPLPSVCSTATPLLQLSDFESLNSKHFLIPVTYNGKTYQALLDSGASSCFISKNLATQLKLPLIQTKNPLLLELGDSRIIKIPDQSLSLALTIGDRVELLNLKVFDMKFDFVLPLSWIRANSHRLDWENLCLRSVPNFDVLSTHHFFNFVSQHEVETFLLFIKPVDSPGKSDTTFADAIRREFPSVFDENFPLPEPRNINHRIDLSDDIAVFGPIYRLSEAENLELRRQIEDLLARNLIRPSSSPYGAPVLFAKKKDGGLRLCIDYKALNNKTIKNKFPLPRIDDLIDSLRSAKCFTKIDLRSCYWQIRMEPGHEYKTAFRTRFGHFEWLVMPFGLTNAPATCQSIMTQLFSKQLNDFVVVYLDDILIYSKDAASHRKHVREIMRILAENNFRLAFSKCAFNVSQVEFLGFSISNGTVAALQPHTSAISNWPVPDNRRDLRQFLGLANYYRKFVRNFANIASPLHSLTSTSVAWNWNDDAQKSFDTLKSILSSPPILKIFDPDLPIVVYCDASKVAIGAVLTQNGHPICFESRKLLSNELNYEIYEKEILSIINALTKWRHYLIGTHFKVLTDSNVAKYLLSKNCIAPRMIKWQSFLLQFNFDIEHIAGSKNIVADSLSRRPDLMYNLSVLDGSAMLSKIRDAYLEDKYFADIILALQKKPKSQKIAIRARRFSLLESGILMFKDAHGKLRTCIPRAIQLEILKEYHEPPFHGHLGVTKTYNKIAEKFFWPKLYSTVERFVRSCDSCQRIKSSNSCTPGELQNLEYPTGRWQSISLDFVTHLPLTANGNNSVLTVTDRFSKRVVLIPTTDDVTTPKVVNLLIGNVFRHFGIPKSIVSDRDPKFTSSFWTELFDTLGTKLLMSSSHHPQTDGQSERTNRTMEEILKHYLDYSMTNWEDLLPMIEIAVNSAVNSSTGISPFELDIGRTPSFLDVFPTTHDGSNSSVSDLLDKLNALKNRAVDSITAAQDAQKSTHDSRHPDIQFETGDKVLLSTKNLLPHSDANRPKKKLLAKWTGPFVIARKLSPVLYELELPVNMRIHPKFHISKLKKYVPPSSFGADRDYSRPNPIDVDRELEYEVEKIVAQRKRRGKTQYLVKWSGYPDYENTWEPVENLTNCKSAISTFKRSLKDPPRSRKRC